MPRDARQHCCIGTGFIVLDVIRNSVGPTITEKRFAGGSCGNVLAILSYLGWYSSAIGRIGDDDAGRTLCADLRQWGVLTDLLLVEGGKGTPVIVQENFVDSKGLYRHRFSRACPVCGADFPAYRPLRRADVAAIAGSLPEHSVFYFDRVAPGTLELAQQSRSKGALVVFEPSGVKDEKLFNRCLEAAHIVKSASDRLQGAHHLIAATCVPLEIVTLGSNGLKVRHRSGRRVSAWKHLPAFAAQEFRDAAGAGDWTTSGFLHALLNEDSSIEDKVEDFERVINSLVQGQALAALNCGFEGARGLMYAMPAQQAWNLSTIMVHRRAGAAATSKHVARSQSVIGAASGDPDSLAL